MMAKLVSGADAHILSVEEHRQGGIKSGEVRREKKRLKEALLSLLDSEMVDENGEKKTGAEVLAASIFKKGKEGSERAFDSIRDTVGEKPKDEVSVDGGVVFLAGEDKIKE